MTSLTSPKGASFSLSDQGIFYSAVDAGCRVSLSAEVNTTKIVAALEAMTSGGVLIIPHGISHNFTSADFPVTSEEFCVWELTGTSFKLTSNQALTSSMGQTLESIRVVTPKVVGIEFVDVLTTPPAYTYQVKVYNNAGSPVVAGSSYDLCSFLPGATTPCEAIARSGTYAGRHYFFNGLYATAATVDALSVTDLTIDDDLTVTGDLTHAGVVLGSRSIQAPATGAAIVMADGTEHLILNHAATIATLTVTLPAAPVDGTPVNIYSRSIVTALTLNAGAGETVATGHGATTLAAAGSVSYVFNSSDSAWYRTR